MSLLNSASVPIGGIVRGQTTDAPIIENEDGSVFIPIDNRNRAYPSSVDYPNARTIVAGSNVEDVSKRIDFTGDTTTAKVLIFSAGQFHVIDDTFFVRSYLPDGTKTQTIDLSANVSGTLSDGTVDALGNFYLLNTGGLVFKFTDAWAFTSSTQFTVYGGLTTTKTYNGSSISYRGLVYLPNSEMFMSRMEAGTFSPICFYDLSLQLKNVVTPFTFVPNSLAYADGIIYSTFSTLSYMEARTSTGFIMPEYINNVTGKTDCTGLYVDADPINPRIYMVDRTLQQIFAIEGRQIKSPDHFSDSSDAGFENPTWYIRVA